MATVRMEFTPEPAYVRTVRLISVAVGRQAGLPDDQLDEVRQAVGEACVRAVSRHQPHGLGLPVVVESSTGDVYRVSVADRAPDLDPPGDDDEALDADVGAALLAGLVKDLDVRAADPGPGSEVHMAWPLRRGGRMGLAGGR